MTILTQNLLSALGFVTAASLLQLLFPLLLRTKAGRMTLRRSLTILCRSVFLLLAYVLLTAILGSIHTPRLTDAENAALPTSAEFYSDTNSNQRALLICDNREALEWRLRLIHEAQTSILLTTFSLHADDSGTELCAALLAAADRGVQVGILTDGYDAMTDNDGKLPFTVLAAHPNIDFHIYAPGNLLRPAKAMARMHEKYLICDNDKLLLGGRNCHDYFLGDHPAKQHNLDLDVLVWGSGGVIDQLTARYHSIVTHPDTARLGPETDWQVIDDTGADLRMLAELLPTCYPESYAPCDYTARTLPCRKISLMASSFEPTQKQPTLWRSLCELMENAQSEVRVHTPYLICDRQMKADLTRIAQAVPLQITLNSPETSANLFGAAVYRNDKPALMQTGADIWEYHGARSLHAKAICIDRCLSVVGSFNFDMRSTYLNSELMLAIDSPALADQLCSFMDAVDGNAMSAAETPSPFEPAVRSFLVGLLRLLERPFRHLL